MKDLLNKYYVYKHINPNGDVFYVGSNHYAGDPNRAYNFTQRSNLWKENREIGFSVEIVKRFLDRKECIKYEHKLIHYYHDIGQCLGCNEDHRGKRNNFYGKTWSPGTHPMLNSKGGFHDKKHQPETIANIRTNNPSRLAVNQFSLDKSLVKKYLSLREVEEKTGYNRKTISRRCKDGKSYKGYIWSFE